MPEQEEHKLARHRKARLEETPEKKKLMQVNVGKMQRATFKSKNARNTRAQRAEAGKMQRMPLAVNTGAQRAEVGKTSADNAIHSKNQSRGWQDSAVQKLQQYKESCMWLSRQIVMIMSE